MRLRHLHGGAFSPTIRGIHENPWRHRSYASQANVRLRVFIEEVQAVLSCFTSCVELFRTHEAVDGPPTTKGFEWAFAHFFLDFFGMTSCCVVIYPLIAGASLVMSLPNPIH